MDPTLIAMLKPAIDVVKGGLKAARKGMSKRKHDQLVSATIMELLKESPDMSAAEAQLAAARATGAEPDASLLRAEGMLDSARKHRARGMTAAARKTLSKTARARWSAKSSSSQKKKPQKKSSGAKRATARKRKA